MARPKQFSASGLMSGRHIKDAQGVPAANLSDFIRVEASF
jgi:hypothetical protein